MGVEIVEGEERFWWNCCWPRNVTNLRLLLTSRITDVVQKIKILIVNQSVVDLCASLFAMLTAVVEVDGTRMSRNSTWDQFICRIWLTRMPLWASLAVSTYGVILTAFERYAAVVYPIWYQVRMRLNSLMANSELDRWRDGSLTKSK